MSAERTKDVDAGADSGGESPMISRRPMTPGRERERKKVGGTSPTSSPSFMHNDMASASPKMFHRQARPPSREGGSGEVNVKSPYDRSLGGAGIGREVKDIYDSSSGEEVSDDDTKKS